MLALALAAGAFAYAGFNSVPGALAALAAAVLVGLVLGWKLLVLRSNEYVVTNSRVIRNTGLLAKQLAEVMNVGVLGAAVQGPAGGATN